MSSEWITWWETRSAAQAHSATHFVVGNEAADLDSVVSAIAYAFLDARHVWIPVIHARRADLHLRRDNVDFLRECGVDIARVCCLDDVPLITADVHVVLVDHNRAKRPFTSATVDAIVDHHVDEHAHAGAARVVLSPDDAGSCASVITARFAAAGNMPRELAMLLYGAICIDTLGLERALGKCHAVDMEAHTRLAPLTQTDPKALCERLLRLRNDTSHLTALDHLRRDYKQMACEAERGEWVIGMASVTVPLVTLVAMPDFAAAASSYTADHALDVLMVLAGYERDGWRRELLFYAPHRGAQRLADKLASMKTHYVDLTPLSVDAALPGFYTAWRQNDVRATRKQFVPAMREACASVAP